MNQDDSSQLQLVLKSLEIKRSSIKNQIHRLNETINKINDNITRLQAYSLPYKDYVFAAQSMHSQFLINNDIFLEKISRAIASAQLEKVKLDKQKQEASLTYQLLLKKTDGLSDLIDAMQSKRQLVRDELEETEQLDRFNATNLSSKLQP